jgi:hypothetical protein
MAQQTELGQGIPIIVGSRSHSDTRHWVGLLWTSDQPDAENSIRQHTTLTRDRHPFPQRDSKPQPQQAWPQTETVDRTVTAISLRLDCIT